MQQKVRINDLARELEVKSKVILDLLIKVGVTEKKTHSSSIEVDEAERVKKYYAEHGEPGSSSSRASRAHRGRVQAQNRSVAHLQARRCAEGDHAEGRATCRCTPRAAAPVATAPPRQSVAPPSAVPARPPSYGGQAPLAAASAAPVAPVEPPKPAPRFITPQSVARPPAAIVIPPAKLPVVTPAAPVQLRRRSEKHRSPQNPSDRRRRSRRGRERSLQLREPRVGSTDYGKSAGSSLAEPATTGGARCILARRKCTPPCREADAVRQRPGAHAAPSDCSANRTSAGLRCAAATGSRARSQSRRERLCRSAASRSFNARVRPFPANFRARARGRDQRERCDRRRGRVSAVVRIRHALARRACVRRSEQEPVQVLLRRPPLDRPMGRPGTSRSAIYTAWRKGRPDEGLTFRRRACRCRASLCPSREPLLFPKASASRTWPRSSKSAPRT